MVSSISNLHATSQILASGFMSKRIITHQLEQDNPPPTTEKRKVEEVEQPNQSKNENHTPAKDYMLDVKPNINLSANKKQVISKYQKERQDLEIKVRIVKGIA